MEEYEIEQIKETLEQNGYEYKEFLGRGSFADVLLCQSKQNQLLFAIKKSLKLQVTEEEYKNLIALSHPYIVNLYGSFDNDCEQYLVMEYCPNGTIKQKGKLSYEKFVYYSKQILEAVAYCHSNKIAHRDIKPENIFIGQYDHVKLADFGMAKKFENNEKTNEKCGSFMFLSPEMFQHHEICPFKADIWALGVTFFNMATGTFPFKNKSRDGYKEMVVNGEIDFNKYDIHPKIKSLLARMLTKNSEHRLSAEKLLEMPIFSKITKLPLLTIDKNMNNFGGYRTKSNNCAISAMRNAILDDKQKMNMYAHIHTYRGINPCSSFKRANRFQPVKTF